MSARITFARDFDPTSRTLFGPLLSVGYCLNRENVAVDAFAWVDFAAPIHSGDIVTLFLKTRHGIEVAGKIMEYTRDGRWWFVCWATREEASLNAMPLDHACRSVLAIAPEVARMEIPRKQPRRPAEVSTTEELRQRLYRLSAPALREWRALGFPPRRAFEGPRGNPDLVRHLLCA